MNRNSFQPGGVMDIHWIKRRVLALSVIAIVCLPVFAVEAVPEHHDFYSYTADDEKNKGIDFVASISVSTPAYCSDVKGDVTVKFKAPGMTSARALCWQQPTAEKADAWGHDVEVASNLKFDAEGNASFVFPAEQFPNGPLIIRIQVKDDGKRQDICELQLFNQGGIVWNQGVPKTDPAAAKGMKLLFADDFDGPLSISSDGKNARYPAHKTGGGDFSGWPFSDPGGNNKPFGQVGTFMRIHASKEPGTKGCTGIISSVREDGSGVSASVPCYFECRFLAQSAPGTWPAFWTVTAAPPKSPDAKSADKGCEELDIIEAYGGWGKGNPNSGGLYGVTTHFWNEKLPDWAVEKGPDNKPNPSFKPYSAVPNTLKLGGHSTWSATFHTYGLLIGETDTIYYCDDIEVLRHPTGPICKARPSWFMINYAIGGISGWKIDLERYGNQSDMWVDWVRVYQGTPAAKP
jgi:hypothetical protein